MRVLIASQVYPPETPPTAIMVDQLAGYLASRGHRVTVAAGHPHHPHGRLPAGWHRSLLSRDLNRGVTVLRGWHPVSSNRALGIRALLMAFQSLGTAGAALAAERPDVVITFGLPLVGPLLSAAVARRFGAATVTVISDIYPDAAIETGKLSNRLLLGAGRLLESLMYRVSDRIVVLSDGFSRTLVERGVPQPKLSVIPVWLDEAESVPERDSQEWRDRNGIPIGQRVVLYAGTIGLVHGVNVIAEAARRLQEQAPGVLMLVVGEGNAKRDLERAAQGIDNVRFLPFQPRDDVGRMLTSADVCLVTLAPGSGRNSVPSKVVAYLAAGTAIIASVDADTDTAAMVRNSGAGWVVEAGDATALANVISRALAAPEELVERGLLGRAWFLEHHAKERALEKYEELILATRRSRPR